MSGYARISIHALLAESDRGRIVHAFLCMLFLSTLSLRRATWKNITSVLWNEYFYPRSPCGERLAFLLETAVRVQISIHALLAESDSTTATTCVAIANFYPRSPCGERLHALLQGHFIVTISIHALLAESDFCTDILHRAGK